MRASRMFFLALACLLSSARGSAGQAKQNPKISDTSTNDAATITVTVSEAPAKAEARIAAAGQPAISLINGKPVMRLAPEHNNKTVDTPQGTTIFLHFGADSGAVGYTISGAGVVEPLPGVYHLPNGTIGILRAIGPGTATIKIKSTGRRPLAEVFNGSISNNWSGYAKTGAVFSSISGEWTVPTAFSDAGDHSSTWIGIDGWGNDNLIQTGTASNYSSGFLGTGLGGGPEYYAWWEVLPDDEQRFSSPVSPGDHMLAIVSLNGDPAPGSAMTWLIFLMNQTKNWTETKTVTYSGQMASAEWITEAPANCIFILGCSIDDLVDYGSVSFDAFDTLDSLSPQLTAGEEITMMKNGNAISTPSDPDGDNDGFTVQFGSAKPLPPGPFITTTSLPVGFLNNPYKTNIFARSLDSLQWFATGLPARLTIDRNTGVLSGTPTASGIFFFSVVARDASNQSVSSQVQNLSVTIQATPPPPDFSLSATPGDIRLVRSGTSCTGSTTITINPMFGFSGSVQLSATGAGVTSAHFAPTSALTTSHLTITSVALCRSTDDDHLLTITAKSGSITHTLVVDIIPVTIVINPCDLPQLRGIRACKQTP
jgi:hypothetical protein